MKNLSLSSELLLHIPRSSNPSCCSTSNPPLFLKPIQALKHQPSKVTITHKKEQTPTHHPIIAKHTSVFVNEHNSSSKLVIMGAVSLGILLLLSEEKALALGPEGPLVEEFWDNVRRYGLYALTVSTGAIYTIVQPIWELLKNPISAILVIVIFGGGFYIVSQVLSAMVGVTDFSYDYAN